MKPEIKPNFLKPRWSKVLSDVWDNKMRTVLVVASIAVGVFAIGMIISAYAILNEDINVSYAAVGPANIEIWTDPFQEDFPRIIEKIEGVKFAEGIRILDIRGRLVGDGWQGLTLIAIDDFSSKKINQLILKEGNINPARGELVVSQDLMRDTGFQVGDEIQIELPNGNTYLLPLVGIAIDQVTGTSNPAAKPNAYVTFSTLNLLGLDSTFNRLLVNLEGSGVDIDYINTVSTDVENRVERNNLNIYRKETNLSQHPMASTILAVLAVMGALGTLITILSSSLIINTLNALLAQHLRQIGIIKLIGGRSYQIMGMYLVLIVIYCVVAVVITLPTGAIAGFEFASYMADLMGAKLQGFRIVPIAIIAQILIAFVIPIGAGFFPVNSGSKINVRRAISNDHSGGQPMQLEFLNRITGYFSKTSRPVLLSIRNTFRKKGRLILTIFTLTIAGGVFIAVFNVRDSMTDFMGQLMQYFMGDVTVSLNQPYPIKRLEQVLLPIPGVNDLEAWGGAYGELLDEDDEVLSNISVIAPPQDTELLNPEIVAGRWINPGEEKAIVVSDSIYDAFPDLQPNDDISIKLSGTRVETWKVVGIFRFIDMLGDPIGYADFDFIADKMNLPNQAMTFRLITDSHDVDSQVKLARYIDKYLQDKGFNIASVVAGEVEREDSSQGIDILVQFLLSMAVLTAFVGSIGLTGTMGMNVLERTREIGVMRAIGAVDKVVMQSVVIEGLLIGLITWVLAIVVSFPISSMLLNLIATSMMGSSMELTYTTTGVVAWLVVVIFLSLFASILPARNAAKLTIREVLSYE
jgi:putative ABC transport system permease protein